MSGNLTVTYQQDTNATSDNLSTILTGFSGSMTIVGELSSQYGDVAGKKFSAAFTIVNGTISGIAQYGNSDLSNEELEKAAVGTLAGYLIGAGAVVVLTTVGLPATAIVLGAGATAIGVSLAGDTIYDKYVYLQQKVFTYLIENEVHPVSSSNELAYINYYQDGFGTIKRFEENMDITATVTYEQLLDSTVFDKIDDNNSSWNIVETNSSEQLAYNKNTLEAIVNTSAPITTNSMPKALEYVFNETQVQTINLNNKNLKVADLTNLELRNAIDGIDKVSFLLSNITIYIGEKLDLGSHGIYEVQSGDTLSVIAQNLNDGTVTKDLVKLNPWLFDAGRIHFNYPDKVLIAAGTAIDSTQDHTLEGDAHAANILKDSNGGNDILIGGSNEDYLYGGEGEDILQGEGGDDYLYGGNDLQTDTLLGGSGFDTYYTGTQDNIKDDGNGAGEIYFNTDLLTGTKTEVEGSDGYKYEDNNYTYHLDNPNGIGLLTIMQGTKQTGFSGKYITVENFDASKDEYLGIKLVDSEVKDITIDISNPTKPEGHDGDENRLAFEIKTLEPLTGTKSVTLNLSIEDLDTDTLDYVSLTDANDNMISSVTLDASNQSQYVFLEIIGDTEVEPNEDLWLNAEVSSKNNIGEVEILPGLGTIENDDEELQDITVDISNPSVIEGDDGDENRLVFNITTLEPLTGEESVTLNLSIEDLDTDPLDYFFLIDSNGNMISSVTLNASNQSQYVFLEVIGDTEVEPNEDLWLNAEVSSKNNVGEVEILPGLGTIENDDEDTIGVNVYLDSERMVA